MNENWANNMRQKLEGHQMAPPAGLWEGISREMNLEEVPAAKPAALRRWLWGGMAAVVLALVGFFVVYQQDGSVPQSRPQAIHTPQKEKSAVFKEERTENRQLALAAVPKPSRHVGTVAKPAEDIILEGIEKEQPVVEPDTIVQDEASKQTPTSTSPHQSTPLVTGNGAVAYERAQQPAASTHSRQWAVGLNASGGLLASNQSRRNPSDYVAANPPSDELNNGSGGNVGPVEQLPIQQPPVNNRTEANHHLPVSLGLSLHYQLTPRLALLSGINYTYLYSEFSDPYRHNSYTAQQLHYVGIPVGLSWQVMKASGFSVYLSGSAKLEKCLNQKPWQWSLGIAAGAEYAITPHVGLYLEPALGYYFNDGTSFEHYYKEHPLAPSIDFGLRLHLTGK